MKVFCQALHAAAVETLCVSIVIWLLFGLPAWGFRQATTASPERDPVWSWLGNLKNDVQQRLLEARKGVRTLFRPAMGETHGRLDQDSQSLARRPGTRSKSFLFRVNNVASLANVMLAIFRSIILILIFARFNE